MSQLYQPDPDNAIDEPVAAGPYDGDLAALARDLTKVATPNAHLMLYIGARETINNRLMIAFEDDARRIRRAYETPAADRSPKTAS